MGAEQGLAGELTAQVTQDVVLGALKNFRRIIPRLQTYCKEKRQGDYWIAVQKVHSELRQSRNWKTSENVITRRLSSGPVLGVVQGQMGRVDGFVYIKLRFIIRSPSKCWSVSVAALVMRE